MKLNQISIVGNVGKAVEEKIFEDGNKVTNFSIAHAVSKNETEWFYVNAYEGCGNDSRGIGQLCSLKAGKANNYLGNADFLL